MIATDVLIVGGGIIGVSLAREMAGRYPGLTITLLEKEAAVACHASGRNSGVLHAGFYYSPDSLKARFTSEGNRLLTDYCLQHHLTINRCGKIVVARNEKEREAIFELKRRGDKNGVELEIIDENTLETLEPNARTCDKALYSPNTSVVNPAEVVGHIVQNLQGNVTVLLHEKFVRREGGATVRTNKRKIQFRYFINSAGLYADKIAHQFGIGRKYTLIPFKGLYLEYKDKDLLRRHIYPVPNLNNPFLGVHFTITAAGKMKIGPTAIPAFWRENYQGLSNFSPKEFFEVMYRESGLFLANAFHFRNLAFEEMKKYYRHYFIQQAAHLVKAIDTSQFGSYLNPGIRAQLLDTEAMKLVMDFVVEHGENSTHILNAVSPAFTSAFSFSKFIVDEVEKKMMLKTKP